MALGLGLLAGLIAARQTRRARNGPPVTLGAALISTRLSYIVLLASTYATKGTT